MKTLRILSITVVITVIFSITNFAVAASLLDPIFNKNATGQEIANGLLRLMMITGSPKSVSGNTSEENEYARDIIKPYLNPAFQLQRSTGERFIGINYVPKDIDDFQIEKLIETRPEKDVRVIRYIVKTNKIPINEAGNYLSDNWAPRLSVLKWNQIRSQWQVVSHANFNYAIAAICDSKEADGYSIATNVSQGDYKLGSDLSNKWFRLLHEGSGLPLMHKKIQGQTANGNGYTTVRQYKPGKISKVALSDIVVSRDKNLLVVSLNAKIESNLYGNVEMLSAKKKPRLLTFLKTPSGAWKMIAVATFNPPSDAPSGSKCN